MQQILDSGATFTGLIASNDLSCLGAIQCLKDALPELDTMVNMAQSIEG